MKKDKPFSERWELSIPAIPPTLNHCTRRGTNNRYFDSAEYESFKDCVIAEILRQNATEKWPPEAHLMVEINFHSPKVFKQRSEVLSRAFGDVDNRVKPLMDSIFKPLGRDDVHAKSITVTKEDSEREHTEVLIEWLN